MKETFIISILADARPLVFTLTGTVEQLNFFQMGARAVLDALGVKVSGIYFEKKADSSGERKVIDPKNGISQQADA